MNSQKNTVLLILACVTAVYKQNDSNAKKVVLGQVGNQVVINNFM